MAHPKVNPQPVVGPQGPPGTSGSSGTIGFGIPGADGEDGVDGYPGTGGPAGPAGAAGAVGATGPAGAMGPPAIDGEDGADAMPFVPSLSSGMSGVLPIANGGTGFSAKFYSRAFDNAGITFTDNVTRSVPFNTNAFDQGGMHSTSVNNTRFTVPVGGAGVYIITGQIAFLSTAAGRFIVTIRKNGTTSLGNMDVQLPAANVQQQIAAPSIVDQAVDGDYYELVGYQLTGGSVGDNTGNSSTWLALARVS